MDRFILLLVCPLLSGAVQVYDIVASKPKSFDQNRKSSSLNTNLDIFCSDEHVMHCYTYNTQFRYEIEDKKGVKTQVMGQAAATIFYIDNSTCSDEELTDNAIVYLIMDSCSEVTDVNIFQMIYVEAKLSNGKWKKCFRQGICEENNSKTLSTITTWSKLDTGLSIIGPNVNILVTSEIFIDDEPTFTGNNENECNSMYGCVNCTEVRVCAPSTGGNSLHQVSKFPCSGLLPYCNKASGTCSSFPDPDCHTENVTSSQRGSSDFVCMRDGYFPDPTDCSVYYNCQNRVRVKYFCSFPYPFYHPGLKKCVDKSEFCTDKSSAYYCADPHYRGKKIPVLHSNDYFLFCGDNKIVVDRCIGHYAFDARAQMCVFDCPHEGLFLKHDNCAQYLKCSLKPGGGFHMTVKKCPDGQGFFQYEFMCVPQEEVPNCNILNSDLFS